MVASMPVWPEEEAARARVAREAAAIACALTEGVTMPAAAADEEEASKRVMRLARSSTRHRELDGMSYTAARRIKGRLSSRESSIAAARMDESPLVFSRFRMTSISCSVGATPTRPVEMAVCARETRDDSCSAAAEATAALIRCWRVSAVVVPVLAVVPRVPGPAAAGDSEAISAKSKSVEKMAESAAAVAASADATVVSAEAKGMATSVPGTEVVMAAEVEATVSKEEMTVAVAVMLVDVVVLTSAAAEAEAEALGTERHLQGGTVRRRRRRRRDVSTMSITASRTILAASKSAGAVLGNRRRSEGSAARASARSVVKLSAASAADA